MDGEGVPAQPTKLVENGVLNNFLYDSYTAGKDGVESTGNAIRGFSNLPTPGATNFIINAGSKASKEEMFGEIREGLFVNDVIGALYPVTQVMLAGNMQEILKHVEMVGNDTRQIYSVVSPSVKVSKVQVVS
jgi:PmbA protein